MLSQDGAIVTVYAPKVEKEEFFSETREHTCRLTAPINFADSAQKS